MKFLIKSLIVIGILSAIGYFSYPPLAKYIEERNKPRWRTEEVQVGEITQVVNATGTVRPTKSIQVGSFVSGPIKELRAEFNQEVEQDEVLATIDTRLFAANVARDEATLATRRAEVARVEALYQQAVNDERRALALRRKSPDFIAQSELDQVKFNRMSLKAQIEVAKASVKASMASLSNSRANLDFCTIRAPEAGTIIDRKVEPGQTLAAQFATPELFVIGVSMREKMHIFADVDESEIGLIREAAADEEPVTYTVTAYPDDLFEGSIEEVRFSSAETQNVVTYPVVVGSPNPDLKLLPGMTADLTFQIKKLNDVVRIPKSALRFYPPDKKYVRPEDHPIIDGSNFDKVDSTDQSEEEKQTNAEERIQAKKKSRKRHVWVVENDLLKAIEVQVGLSDNRFSELISGEVTAGTALVTGQKAKGEE